jgi:hypothetical protein
VLLGVREDAAGPDFVRQVHDQAHGQVDHPQALEHSADE